jgi:hypothetical protein
MAAPSTVSATTHLKTFTGMSTAGLFLCTDGEKYVFKHAALQRALVAEHIVGRLGIRIGAPCMEVFYGEVPGALIALQPELARFGVGKCHATRFIDGLVERKGQPAYFDIPINRSRFAALLVLYTWLHAADHQLMYELAPPNQVYSHDHGLFFPGSHGWSAATIVGATTCAKDRFFDPIGLLPAELVSSVEALRGVTDIEIDEIVNGALADWGVTDAELVALASCLRARRVDCLTKLGK